MTIKKSKKLKQKIDCAYERMGRAVGVDYDTPPKDDMFASDGDDAVAIEATATSAANGSIVTALAASAEGARREIETETPMQTPEELGVRKPPVAKRYKMVVPDRENPVFVNTHNHTIDNKSTFTDQHGKKTYMAFVQGAERHKTMDCRFDKAYGDTVITDQGEKAVNLFPGFRVVPKAGNCDTLREFVEFISSGDAAAVGYVEKYLAWKSQNITRAPQVALVLRSEQGGTGKGTLGELLTKLWSPAAKIITDPQHILGTHNDVLMNTVAVFADEAFFAANSEQRDRLYSFITTPSILINPKNKTIFPIRNAIALIMATNHAWAVPVTHKNKRRFAVLDVPETRVGDKTYWKKVYAAISDPSQIAAYAEHLLALPLNGWRPADHIPLTAALQEQVEATEARTVIGYLRTCLERGAIPSLDTSHGSSEDICRVGEWKGGAFKVDPRQRTQMLKAIQIHTKYDAPSRQQLNKLLETHWGAKTAKTKDGMVTVIPRLDKARTIFAKRTGTVFDDGMKCGKVATATVAPPKTPLTAEDYANTKAVLAAQRTEREINEHLMQVLQGTS